MKKFKLTLVVLILLAFAVPVFAQLGIYQDGTNKGAAGDLNFKAAQVTGQMKKTVDISDLQQPDSTLSTTPVVSFTQAATTGPVFKFNGTAAAGSTVEYSTTSGSGKIGGVKVSIPGLSCGTSCYIRVYDSAQ